MKAEALATYIHGSTDPREVARLEKQARFCAPFILDTFEAKPGERVLDLATGVGAMAAQLRQRFPGIQLVGLELSESQLAAARENHPEIDYVQGDAAHMPFADASFDKVHCSWLLEHVPNPLAILREVRRVLVPGGVAHFIEVDNATLATHPSFPELETAWAKLNERQQSAGGDPFVGQKLKRLFEEAGFREVRVTPSLVEADATQPAHFRDLVEEFAEILESAEEALGDSEAPLLHLAASQLRSVLSYPNGSMRYSGVKAIGRT